MNIFFLFRRREPRTYEEFRDTFLLRAGQSFGWVEYPDRVDFNFFSKGVMANPPHPDEVRFFLRKGRDVKFVAKRDYRGSDTLGFLPIEKWEAYRSYYNLPPEVLR